MTSVGLWHPLQERSTTSGNRSIGPSSYLVQFLIFAASVAFLSGLSVDMLTMQHAMLYYFTTATKNADALNITINRTADISPSSVTISPETSRSIRLSRKLPMVGNHTLEAEWIFNSTMGSFWLPQPPPRLIDGYHVKTTGNQFYKENYKNRSGFVTDGSVEIMMSRTFNAGDFVALWVAPMIAGRRAFLNDDGQTNRCSLAVVGSILQWSIRYSWGPGFIEKTSKLQHSTERVFALRGPVSYEQTTLQGYESDVKISSVYGDAGSLMSWYYQPHNQTKAYPLCFIPHYVDAQSPFIQRMKKMAKTHVINIMDPLFGIMDQIVKCDFVLSSTLHGIIFSDSYGIANAHMLLSNRVTGIYHKFEDYFQSVDRPFLTLNVTKIDSESSEIKEVSEFVKKSLEIYDPSWINLMPYWENCPMHAEAYNRTREDHLKFSQMYAKAFAEALKNRASKFGEFREQVEAALMD